MIDKLQSHYGFKRMPFGRDLAPGMLHRHASHNEAVARITWCIAERSIGVVTGEVGAGKTVSVRTVLHSIDPSRHTVIYLPNPMLGVRGIHEAIVTAFGQQPSHLGSRLTAQTGLALAAEREERGRTPSWSSTKPTCCPTNSSKPSACSPTRPWTRTHRCPACSSASLPSAGR
ncbi:AAA family ATPase [Streptomyces vietnamensis]|uniref:AAA family ATPase n=1 Tax=Streptomyces vietnamensis TaxID=362257 RepID=UPI00378CD37A